MRKRSAPATPPAPVTRLLRIDDLVQLPEYQMRRDARGRPVLDRGAVARYATAYRAGQQLPPIRVAILNDAPVVVDGWHRIAALRQTGAQEVLAEVYTGIGPREALAMAAKANLEHGVPLKRREVRNAFRALIKAREHIGERGRLKSYREIAEMLGGQVAYTTVRNWMLEDFPAIFERYAGNDGREAEPWREGGQRLDLQEALEGAAMEALQSALASARGVTSEARRGRIVAEARRVMAELEAGGRWVLPDADRDF